MLEEQWVGDLWPVMRGDLTPPSSLRVEHECLEVEDEAQVSVWDYAEAKMCYCEKERKLGALVSYSKVTYS